MSKYCECSKDSDWNIKIHPKYCRFDNEERDFHTETETNLENEVYDVMVTARMKKSEIRDESPVTCVVSIPNTDYMKRETITYDGMKSFLFSNNISAENDVQMSLPFFFY